MHAAQTLLAAVDATQRELRQDVQRSPAGKCGLRCGVRLCMAALPDGVLLGLTACATAWSGEGGLAPPAWPIAAAAAAAAAAASMLLLPKALCRREL